MSKIDHFNLANLTYVHLSGSKEFAFCPFHRNCSCTRLVVRTVKVNRIVTSDVVLQQRKKWQNLLSNRLLHPNPPICRPLVCSVRPKQSELFHWCWGQINLKPKPRLSLLSSDICNVCMANWARRTTWTYVETFLEQRLSHHVSQHPDQRRPLQTAQRNTLF